MRSTATRPETAAVAAALVCALLLAAPDLARACSVCSAGRDGESQTAFILTTLFLTLLPLLGLGTAAWWLLRRARALEARSASPTGRPPQRGTAAALEG